MQKRILGVFLAAETVAALMLAGCGAFDYDGLRAMSPEGPEFDRRLALEYQAFALYESDDMMDWPDAAHFGAKAVQASQGMRPGPESPADWRLPKDQRGSIAAAYARLASALEGGGREISPEHAAVAQARFDCWVEQQEENWQFDHIARCRDGFFAALADMETGIALAEADTGADGAIRPAVAEGGPAAAPNSFSIFFAFDAAGLDDAGRAVVDAVAEAAKAGRGTVVTVAGHADRAGGDAYNDTLSRRRAEAVAEALAARGIARERIGLTAFGERRPRIETPDGAREPRNRRAEITVAPATDL